MSRSANTLKRVCPKTTKSYTAIPKRRKVSSYDDNYVHDNYNNKETDIIVSEDTIIEKENDIIVVDDNIIEKETDVIVVEDKIIDESEIIEEEEDDETTDNITKSNVVHTDNDNNIVEEDVNIRRSEQEIINIVDSNSVLLYNRNQNKSSSESDYEEWDDLSESKILNIITDYEK